MEHNRALNAALACGLPLIPVFILDPALFPNCPEAKKDFLLDGLQCLDLELRRRGSRLILRAGNPPEALRAVLSEAGGGQIFAAADYSPYALRRDRRITRELPVTFVKGDVRIAPPDLLTASGRPFQVFTPFARAWRERPELFENLKAVPDRLPAVDLHSLDMPACTRSQHFPSGEQEARIRLEKFISEGIYSYPERRDRPDLDGTSRLSPYLHLGMVSAERAIQTALEAERMAPDRTLARGASAWLNELIWREFYIHILFHYPEVRTSAFKPALRGLSWRRADAELDAWKHGRTGCPIVDAGMRQLRTTGWMHNRVRMITASYLVKDLLIDWREGERWFAQALIDYDLAANNGGWQWTAGTGTDSSPYFRIFNPVLQGKKFDPRGNYVRQWVPELADLPDRFIHEPWKMPAGTQPQGYPPPLVDHNESRIRTLAFYRDARRENIKN